MPRYKLRTLLILLTIGPPMVAVVIYLSAIVLERVVNVYRVTQRSSDLERKSAS